LPGVHGGWFRQSGLLSGNHGTAITMTRSPQDRLPKNRILFRSAGALGRQTEHFLMDES
jgi:hypothetical protein